MLSPFAYYSFCNGPFWPVLLEKLLQSVLDFFLRCPNHALLLTALNDCGITETLAPAWFPEGFSLSEHKIISNDSGNTVSFFFNNTEQKYFTIQIIKVNSASDIETYLFEKDDSAVKQYVSQGKTFYFLSNLDNQTATWSDGNSLVMIILGNISENDIKAMIDSIGGV